MTYLDTSVALAHVLAADRLPPAHLWQEPLVCRAVCSNTRCGRASTRDGWAGAAGDEVRAVLGRVSLVELMPPVLARALEPFPASVRTLDALHLASMDFLRASGQRIRVASYDERLIAAARAFDFPILDL